MSVQLTPSKRQNETEAIGTGKLHKNGNSSSPNSQVNGNILRVFCPGTKVDSVIGKDCSIISQISQETGVRIQVEEPVPGSDDRVITLIRPDKDDGRVDEQSNKEGNDENKETGTRKNDGDQNDHNEDKPEAGPVDIVSAVVGKDAISAMQKALILVFERMFDGNQEKDGGGGELEGDKVSTFAVRLLVFSGQIGSLLGKQGSIIKRMASESGAQIRVLPRDKLPPSVSSSDEFVQISGVPDAVRKALSSVCQQLLENPRSFPGDPSGPSPNSFGRSARPDGIAQPNHTFHGLRPPYSAGFRDGEAGFPDFVYPPQDVLTYRLWCSHDKIGGVIGKGGFVVRAIQNETGCEIKVLDYAADSEDRIILISGPAHPDERISAPQDAVLRVQSRIFRASPESQDKNLTAKLLVPTNQIGCLLGKGGSIITEMRKATGAYIRILGKDQNPQGALENDELVQINGESETIQEALLQITSRLREHFFRDAFPSMNYPSNPAFPDQVPPYPPFMGRREHSPSGMYRDLGPPFHKFDSVGGPPPGGFHPLDERPPFMQNFHRPGFPPHMPERFPSSAPWGPQGPLEVGGPMGPPDFPGGPPRGIGGFGGVNHGAIITNTTVEVVVPRSVVPAIYGEGGGCLRQIREISDAKITITDTKPGVQETVIIISGTPEQTNAAQSLIQAFVISETEAN
ncbi:OLC1v1017097C1 [Oldenlandia corymbosa var. corymbosa]|uniref:OLC1v1017097C1 n=1 Tax=Oldenlandia corymbosa var. corymbosa TaxID=529605 RepID=A0AAV1E8P0_OLDCO|nr:OLC1v1017097C1 [Oldenlandia corymbosa var. corymbosa]